MCTTLAHSEEVSEQHYNMNQTQQAIAGYKHIQKLQRKEKVMMMLLAASDSMSSVSSETCSKVIRFYFEMFLCVMVINIIKQYLTMTFTDYFVIIV